MVFHMEGMAEYTERLLAPVSGLAIRNQCKGAEEVVPEMDYAEESMVRKVYPPILHHRTMLNKCNIR